MGSPSRLPTLPELLVTVLLAGPVLAGLAGTALPAFGYLPVLGYENFSLGPFIRLSEQPGLLRSVVVSFATGLTASIISLAIVLVFAAGWYGTATFRRVSRLISPLLSVPHAAAAIGLAFLIAPSGFLVRLVSPWATGWTQPPDVLIVQDPMGLAMTLGLIAKEVPFLFLMTLAALNRPHVGALFKAGESLGYGHMTVFFKVVLPQIYPLIRLPVLAVIAYATSVVDVAQVLGPTTPAPLAPRLVGWMNDPDLSRRLMASAGALLQLFVSSGAILAYLLLERAGTAILKSRLQSGHRRQKDWRLRQGALAGMSGIVLLMILSMSLLAMWALAKSWWFPAALPQKWGLSRAGDALIGGGPALLATLAIALVAALVATALTLWHLEAGDKPLANSSKLTSLVFLPLLLPQIGFLFGLQMLFLLLELSGSFAAVLLAHLVFVLPYAVLSLRDPWKRLDPRYEKAAAALGASRMRIFWKVRFPILLRPILTTFAVAGAVSVGQYLPTLMIGAGRIVTVTTESVALASGGNRQVAALYAILQLLIPLGLFSLAALVPSLVYRNRASLRTVPH